MCDALKHPRERRSNYYREGRLFDPDRRLRKAEKILTVLRDCSRVPLSELTCLDVGSSAGIMTHRFVKEFQSVAGIDVDREALKYASQAFRSPRLAFTAADGAHLPFPDEQFDVVICAQVYEHAGNPYDMADEIFRVLKEGGLCFFSGPNKLSIMEEHSGLPLIHWLPRRAANWLVRRARRGERFEENLMTYWNLRRLWRKFTIMDYSPALITDPIRFSLRDEVRPGSLASRLPASFYRLFAFAVPNPNWILAKQKHRNI